MEDKGIKVEDKLIILQDLQSQVTGQFTYFQHQYNNLDELFAELPFEGFYSRADNIRWLYKEVRINGVNLVFPLWIKERYFYLFERYDNFNSQKLI